MQAFLPDFSGAGAAGLSVAGTDHTGALGGEPQPGSLNLADLVTSAIRNKTQVIAAASVAWYGEECGGVHFAAHWVWCVSYRFLKGKRTFPPWGGATEILSPQRKVQNRPPER